MRLISQIYRDITIYSPQAAETLQPLAHLHMLGDGYAGHSAREWIERLLPLMNRYRGIAEYQRELQLLLGGETPCPEGCADGFFYSEFLGNEHASICPECGGTGTVQDEELFDA